MRTLIFVLMTAMVFSPSVRGGEIILNMLGSTADHSAITGTCTYEKTDSTIRCQTIEIFVSYALDPKDFDKEWKAAAAQFDMDVKTDADAVHFCKNDLSDLDKIENALKRPTTEQRAGLAIVGPGLLQDATAMIEMCKHPTRSAYRQLLYKLAFAETQQCQVKAAPPGIDVLKKVNDTKWIGVTGPGGLCNVVATSTLERENKKSELWTWTDVTSTTDSSELCKKSGVTQSVNKPSVFTWKSGRFPMHCEAVDFGH